MNVDDPRFPPLISGHGVNAPAAPFDVASRAAADGTLGAADLVWARNTSRIDCALILEPDVPRLRALEMLAVFEVATIEALGALMPPKTSVLLRWPDAILVNGGIAGRFRYAAAPSADDEVPDWLVLGAEIDLMPAETDIEPGHFRDRTCLVAEGSEDKTRSDALEVISAYFLSWLDTWQTDRFRPVSESWLGRVEGHADETRAIPEAVSASEGAVMRVMGVDEDLNLLVKVDGRNVVALPFADKVETFAATDRKIRADNDAT